MCVWHQYDNRLSQPNGHSFIHLWKLIEENLTKMESRGQKVILLCRYLSTSTQIPKRDCISDRKWQSSLLLPEAAKIIFSLAFNSSTVRDCHNSANGKLPSYPTLWGPKDCSLPGSSVHGIIQARTLECVGISSSREFSWQRDRTRVS